MSDRLRYRKGQVALRKVAVDSATVIEAGDMVWLDTDDAKPASDYTWSSDLATTQAGFAAKFLGIAQEPSAAGETDDILVDVSPDSVYEFQCASATHVVGAPMGPDLVGSETLGDQTLEAAVATSAVARCAETTGTATKVLATFASAYHTGSGNVNANVG